MCDNDESNLDIKSSEEAASLPDDVSDSEISTSDDSDALIDACMAEVERIMAYDKDVSVATKCDIGAMDSTDAIWKAWNQALASSAIDIGNDSLGRASFIVYDVDRCIKMRISIGGVEQVAAKRAPTSVDIQTIYDYYFDAVDNGRDDGDDTFVFEPTDAHFRRRSRSVYEFSSSACRDESVRAAFDDAMAQWRTWHLAMKVCRLCNEFFELHSSHDVLCRACCLANLVSSWLAPLYPHTLVHDSPCVVCLDASVQLTAFSATASCGNAKHWIHRHCRAQMKDKRCPVCRSS